MGEKKVSTQSDETQLRAFTKAVLNDLQALEKMFEMELMEEDVMRIGAEQEMFLVDEAMRPANKALEIIEAVKDGRLTTEIGQFNLEANLTPQNFEGKCLSRLEAEILEVLGMVRNAARALKSDFVLTGILPTIQESDLKHENLTPYPRYHELNRVVTELHGKNRVVHIKGIDDINLTLQDVLIETCNTSFQIHLQVSNRHFISAYNWAQAIAAPVLAIASNSPMLLGRRLWHETRIALFQQAVDTRSVTHQLRNQTPRVTFGRDWVNDSILEIFREDVARYRIILTRELEEDSLETLKNGGIPRLGAWRMHNGTVWRWNRACYGVLDGKPSLRVEARFLPSGPSVADEMANSAFFLGLMLALPQQFGDVKDIMPFDKAKNNFHTAARYGIKSQIEWLDGNSYRAAKLISEQLLPLAEYGLKSASIDAADIDRYLDIISERTAKELTGAEWMLSSWTTMDQRAKPNIRLRTLTCEMIKNQKKNKPVHVWNSAAITEKTSWIDNYQTVEQFMTRDLFTVRPEDVIDLAANLMSWKHIRHVPVEDDGGNLIGIISSRDLLEIVASQNAKDGETLIVRDVMKTDLLTIPPETPTLEALYMMREKNIGCLPVVKGNKLVGVLTAHDFLTVSTVLLEEKLKNFEKKKPKYDDAV